MKITIKGNVPMLNGSNGLIRMHWSKRKKLKRDYHIEILSQKPRKFKGRVNVRITRYSSAVPDPDNVGASFKLIGDALVDAGVIQDDNMGIIKDFSVSWEKSSNKEQRTEIDITQWES